MAIKLPAPTLPHAVRLIHTLLAVALVAWLLYSARDLFLNFYLPYSLEDMPVVPTATVTASPESRTVLTAAELLRLRQEQPALVLPVRDTFHPTPTSTIPSATGS